MTQSILVIDDSPHIHQLIEVRLRPEAVVIYRANDAAEGLTLARAHLPDLVLLDLDLPGTGGLDVCRQLKAAPETSALPVIVLTSLTDVKTKVEAFDLGAVDYVTKPFDAVELRARVRAALRTKHFQDLLATRAQLDGLTGLWNRAYFDARLREEVAAASRHARKVSLALIDVDHFKRVNDTYGHPFGDGVLRAVATTVTAAIRASDILCRYGGEEFVVIFREAGDDEGYQGAERIREAISTMELSHQGSAVRVTASVGVAANDPSTDATVRTPEQLIEAADRALYAAKRAGRNRVCRATRD